MKKLGIKKINSQFLLIYFLLSVMSLSLAQAADQSYIDLIGYYKKPSNISNQPETTPAQYLSGQEINVGLHLQPGWALQVIYGTAADGSYNYSGGGFRIHTPGIFLIPNGKSDTISKKRRSPVDTSVHAELMKMYDKTDLNLSTSYYISRAGFTLDWVPIKNGFFYLSLDLSTLLIRSDLFLHSGVGLGLEF